MKERRLARTLSLIAFAIGVLLGSVLIGIAVWGDLEAKLFNPGVRPDASLGRLRCPVMLTKAQETATISVRIKNTLDRATRFFARARISEGFLTLMREETTRIPLEPGEAERLEWQVNADDAAFGRIIFFKVVISGGYPLPSREGTCGIVLVDIPYLTGNQVYALGVAVSLASLFGGGGLWIASNPHRIGIKTQITRVMGTLTSALLIGIIGSLLGWWILGLLVLVIILLSIGALIGYLGQ